MELWLLVAIIVFWRTLCLCCGAAHKILDNVLGDGCLGMGDGITGTDYRMRDGCLGMGAMVVWWLVAGGW